MLRAYGLDPIDCRLERQCQLPRLPRIDRRISLCSLFLKFDARELINDIPQLRGIIVEGADGAGKNYCKINLWRSRRKWSGGADDLPIDWYHL
jgi:hypothetical protein